MKNTNHRPSSLAFLFCLTLIATGQAQEAKSGTIWHFLGVPQSVEKLQKAKDCLVNKKGNFPGLESKPPLLKIADPANAAGEAPNKLMAAAQKIKVEEDKAPQKIKAVKYLARLGCMGCYEEIDEAFVAGLQDCTEEVRYETIKAIERTLRNACDDCGGRCCGQKIKEELVKRAYQRDENNPECWYERSDRVRKGAARLLQTCGTCIVNSPMYFEPTTPEPEVIPPTTPAPPETDDGEPEVSGAEDVTYFQRDSNRGSRRGKATLLSYIQRKSPAPNRSPSPGVLRGFQQAPPTSAIARQNTDAQIAPFHQGNPLPTFPPVQQPAWVTTKNTLTTNQPRPVRQASVPPVPVTIPQQTQLQHKNLPTTGFAKKGQVQRSVTSRQNNTPTIAPIQNVNAHVAAPIVSQPTVTTTTENLAPIKQRAPLQISSPPTPVHKKIQNSRHDFSAVNLGKQPSSHLHNSRSNKKKDPRIAPIHNVNSQVILPGAQHSALLTPKSLAKQRKRNPRLSPVPETIHRMTKISQRGLSGTNHGQNRPKDQRSLIANKKSDPRIAPIHSRSSQRMLPAVPQSAWLAPKTLETSKNRNPRFSSVPAKIVRKSTSSHRGLLKANHGKNRPNDQRSLITNRNRDPRVSPFQRMNSKLSYPAHQLASFPKQRMKRDPRQKPTLPNPVANSSSVTAHRKVTPTVRPTAYPQASPPLPPVINHADWSRGKSQSSNLAPITTRK